MDKQGLLDLIEKSKKDNVTELDLSSKNLEELPPEIASLDKIKHLDLRENSLSNKSFWEVGKLTNLTNLNLEGNNLCTVPLEITKLSNLCVLRLGNNKLENLPKEIQKFSYLKHLSVWGNQLVSLPKEIGRLASLKHLNLWENKLTNLPPEIGQLLNLTNLNLWENKLTNLPPEIGQLLNLTNLNLVGNSLTYLPLEIGSLKFLTDLDLWGNQLVSLPKEIGWLTKLKTLDLEKNQLQSLPSEIGHLELLENLNLLGNQLKQLPKEIGNLKKLKELHLNDNQLVELPKEVGSLKKLTGVYLRKNKLSKIPKEISFLKELKLLDIEDNCLKQLPSAICQLDKLEILDLQQNQLVQLPIEIKGFSSLRRLNLEWNLLSELPAGIGKLSKLEELYLANNLLTQLPEEIKNLHNLKKLSIKNNKLKIPEEKIPKEILTKLSSKIIQYILDLQKSIEQKPLHEAKLIFVGTGEVGKTSLVNRLTKDIFNPNELKTEGIEIVDWQMQLKQKQIKLHIWDFGGQEIMHATHQFFMTKRSIYVLVINSRIEDRYGDSAIEYWLKLIGSYGGDSPIIVVINKTDIGKMDIGKGALKDKFPNIVGYVETSCKENDGIDQLVSLIKKSIGNLSHLDDLLPSSYFEIKSTLEQTNKEYLDYVDYIEICKNVDKNITPTSIKTLVGLLHDLGTILNFQENRRLEETQVLDPQWATQGVYKIINSPILQENKGILSFDEASEILASDKYPTKRVQGFIMDLMEHFQLCYQMPERKDTYFIPGSFPKDPPGHFSWDSTDTLRFQYHYDIMPASIISNFIVRMHDLIKDNNYWRNGIVIEHENNLAFIKANPNDEQISIEVKGKEKKITLAFIRGQLQIIHNNLSKISVEQMIPLDEESKIVVEYEQLLFSREQGVKEYLCWKLKKKFSVDQLLEGIETKANPGDLLNSQEEESLVRDCVKNLNKSQVKLTLMKLDIPPSKIIDSLNLTAYYRNVIRYLLAVRKLEPWLEQLGEYWFTQQWLETLRG